MQPKDLANQWISSSFAASDMKLYSSWNDQFASTSKLVCLQKPQLEHVLDTGGTIRVVLRLVVGSRGETDASGHRVRALPLA
jgi:hypothetical protein